MEISQHTIRQRIKILIEEFSEGVQRRFAAAIGVNPTTISEIFGKRQNAPSVELLQKIADTYPQLRTEWLLLGEGDMLKHAAPEPATEERAVTELDSESINVKNIRIMVSHRTADGGEHITWTSPVELLQAFEEVAHLVGRINQLEMQIAS